MHHHHLTVLSPGHSFLEGPRWHDGALWISDVLAREVRTLAPDGTLTTVATIPGSPSGLGFLPDGTPLVVSHDDRAVDAIRPDGSVERYADLSGVTAGPANDMYVSPEGHAYVGNFGFVLGAEDPRPTRLIHIRPDRTIGTADGDLLFPNGTVRTPDGTLLVAETFAHRISAFDIDEDGAPGKHRVWAQFDEAVQPDGMTLDSDGGVWFGNALTRGPDSGFYRAVEGGELTDVVPVADAWAVAPVFGGPDLSTLYLMCNDTTLEDFIGGRSTAYVATATVGRRGVPGSS